MERRHPLNPAFNETMEFKNLYDNRGFSGFTRIDNFNTGKAMSQRGGWVSPNRTRFTKLDLGIMWDRRPSHVMPGGQRMSGSVWDAHIAPLGFTMPSWR